MISRPILFFLLAIIAHISFVRASTGDQLDEFKRCVNACKQLTCSENLSQDSSNNEFLVLHFMKMPLPFILRMFWWDCGSNCDYQCQDVINILRKQNQEELYQFHGKWFFIRHFHIQEPASCIFSIFNFIAHYWGLKVLDKKLESLKKLVLVNSDEESLGLTILFREYKIMCRITMMAWVFSTIFHLRDLDITEKLDYFFAGLTVLSGLYVAVIRLFKLFKHQERIFMLRVVILFIYACHVIRLLYDWSYSYNMQINLLWAVVQYSMWLTFSIKNYVEYTRYLFRKDYRKRQLIENLYLEKRDNDKWTDLKILYLKYELNGENYKCLAPILLCIWVSCGLIFEVFDFPPWRDLVDAHALWHLTTVLPGGIWYYWMVWDSNKLSEKIF